MLVVEDVWTTGGSTREAMRVVEEVGACVVAAGALIDRNGVAGQLGVTAKALLGSCDPELRAEGLPVVRGREYCR